MTIYEYLILNDNQRAQYLWEHGTHLLNHIENGKGYLLYKLNGFYVEVVTHDTSIAEVMPFIKGERLEKYLAKIPLPT